jgi:hypothetical protein
MFLGAATMGNVDVFEMKTGRFTPLDSETLASLSEPQANAYSELSAAVEAQASADAEVENARADNDGAVKTLDFARQNAPKPRTFLEEWRASKRL